ncbi:hypothetical protein L6164_027546 [Bauhinia variegata]|uniref:Uncharacterized protein n=1 Tax=Bauhinia variegata TaxID=167791 RepID=A0ACB9LUA0_BAUVA|nr:hypothetical protein L6164_027546 [Bauhinia variegata]
MPWIFFFTPQPLLSENPNHTWPFISFFRTSEEDQEQKRWKHITSPTFSSHGGSLTIEQRTALAGAPIVLNFAWSL